MSDAEEGKGQTKGQQQAVPARERSRGQERYLDLGRRKSCSILD